jgi:serine/threonine protein kinase
MADELINQTLGQFHIIRELGRGGMAVVYEAYQPSLQRRVALKVLPPRLAHDADLITRFRQEAIAAAKLRHPNIIAIHDVCQTDDLNYIVMDLLEGSSLSSAIRNQPMSPARVVNIIGQVASALDYAHQHDFVHRDIKPSNIMLDPDDHATLMDFGIAKALGGTRLTQTGMAIGTPEYMSPEQVMGSEIDQRTDVYSLGIVAYEMLTGHVPFSGTTASVLYRQANEPPPPPRVHLASISPSVESVILRALAKKRDERYGTAGQFARALSDAVANSMASTSPATPSVQNATATRQAARPWVLWAAAAFAAIVLLTTVAIAVLALGNPGGWRSQATSQAGAGVTPGVPASSPIAAPPHTDTPAPIGTRASGTPSASASSGPTRPAVAASATYALLVMETLSWDDVANSSLSTDYASPPTGRQTLGGVSFDLNGRVFKTQAQPAPNNTYPVSTIIKTDIQRVEQVYVLLTAGNAFTRWQGKTVGRIALVFSNAASVEVPLVLGENLREWHAADNVVSTAPKVRQVWQGPIAGHPDLIGTLDMLTIAVPAAQRDATLTQVEIRDTSSEEVGSLDPALSIWGVTVAHR